MKSRLLAKTKAAIWKTEKANPPFLEGERVGSEVTL
jgi:hypothetical protein